MTRGAVRLDGFPRWPIFAGLNILAAALAYGSDLLAWIDDQLDVWADE